MIPTAFEYHAPSSVADAARLLAQHGSGAKLLAGGHSLIPLMKLRLAQPEVLIDLGKIGDMSYIRDNNGGLAIGAMTTYNDIEHSDLVISRAQALAEGSGMVADRQVRNRGTIGGSMAHADPAGDLPAVVIALDAQMVTSSTGEHRTISADASLSITAYAKFGNKASHYAVVGVAASITLDGSGTCTQARIGITGAGPKATRAAEVEDALKGNKMDDGTIRGAASLAGSGIDFNEDIHASGEYRAHLVTVFAERAIRQAAARAG